MKIEGRVGVGDFCFEIEDGGYGETCGILDQNCVKVGGVGWVTLPPSCATSCEANVGTRYLLRK